MVVQEKRGENPMSIKQRTKKLAQQASQAYPHPSHLLSAEERRARILELLRKANCSEEDIPRLMEEAKQRVRERAQQGQKGGQLNL